MNELTHIDEKGNTRMVEKTTKFTIIILTGLFAARISKGEVRFDFEKVSK